LSRSADYVLEEVIVGGQKTAQQHSWSTMVELWEEAYLKMLC
jgi:hypothetical protein